MAFCGSFGVISGKLYPPLRSLKTSPFCNAQKLLHDACKCKKFILLKKK